MIQNLHEVQLKAGAIFEADGSTPCSFGNDRHALQAAQSGVALCDRSHWGLLKFSGDDRLRYLHNQSTNDFNRLQPGNCCDTVFVTSTGRTLDLATAYVTEEEILVLVSPNRRQQLMEWLDSFIFPMDWVELTDSSQENAIFSLIGSESDNILKQLGIEEILGKSAGNHQLVAIESSSVRVAVGSGLAIAGYTLIVPLDKAAKIWYELTTMGSVPLGDRVWEQLRIQQGRPAPDRELTKDYNPLEAGLWRTISFEKGCYIGQETIARLNTYKGVKQRLWGVQLKAPVEAGSVIKVEDNKVGILTSYTDTEQGSFGLGYVRTKAGGAGLKVEVGETEGELVSVPFLTHEYYQPNN
ncbi:MAG: folate-binding protein YgfZ [Moorea sp. SIO2B7]|nr:folate-binding protein YgfZ [Moorena sp. SIO2B7]